MVIDASQVQAMIDHARMEFPNEACGLLAGRDERILHVYPATNAAASPVQYRLEAREQLRILDEIDERGWQLSAIYHSHPRTRAYPSPTDIELAAYEDALYIIVSLATRPEPEVRAYRIREGQVTEEPVELDRSPE